MTTPNNPARQELLSLVDRLARLSNPNFMENDDNCDTLAALRSEARELLGLVAGDCDDCGAPLDDADSNTFCSDCQESEQ